MRFISVLFRLDADIEECSPLLAEYFRTRKVLDDVSEEEKPVQLVFEITSNDGFCVRARSCDGNNLQRCFIVIRFSCINSGQIDQLVRSLE